MARYKNTSSYIHFYNFFLLVQAMDRSGWFEEGVGGAPTSAPCVDVDTLKLICRKPGCISFLTIL